jgi:putative membrane protein
LLQHAATLPAIAFLANEARKGWLSLPAFACLVAFLGLHVVGARWVYSNVPYDSWSAALFGGELSEFFGWKRNHYDRFVHLAFGALLILPLAEVAARFGRMSPAWATCFAVLGVMTASAFYEIFEWWLTITMAPLDAEVYNGQQGDMWDAQKDMALAMGGAILVAVVYALVTRYAKANRRASSNG